MAARRRRQFHRARADDGRVHLSPALLHRRSHGRCRQGLMIHVISHTHWDREWYLTYEQFRLRLVGLIDRLLDLMEQHPDFEYFHLDGQTIVLEDYLELRPQ